MKPNPTLAGVLNQLLADELAAISECMVHSELCAEWGYKKLHKALKHQAKDEMRHAEWLVERIITLESAPEMSKLRPLKIAKAVPDMVDFNEAGEESAIAAYNRAILAARKDADEGTADLLLRILKMEEAHLEWAERQRRQIKDLGLPQYLARQTKGASY